jgi:hypothetical protein
MRGWPIAYTDFSGGLNTQSGPYLLEGNQTREALNVHTSQTGDIEKRFGFTTLSGSTLTGSPINGTEVHTLFPSNTATKSLIGVARTATTDTIFKMTTAGVASALKTGLTANTRWWFAQAEVNGSAGPIFGLNGVDAPIRWNGEAASTSEWVATTGTVPKEARFLTYWSSRLWCAKGSRLYYSGITGSTPDPLNWDPEGFVDMEPNDGQEISGIGVVGSYLIVFKPRKIYNVYEPTNGAFRQVSNSVGCIAPRSIVQTPIGLIFLSEDQGICKTDGNSVTPFSDTIKPDIDRVLSTPTTAKFAAATMVERRYMLSVSRGGTRNDRTYEYDMVAGSWWPHSCASNCFALLDPAGSPQLYSGDSLASARVSKAFAAGTFIDNGAVFRSLYVTPYYAWGNSGSFRYQRYIDPHKVKRIREIRVDGLGNWQAYVAVDFRDVWQRMAEKVWARESHEEPTFGGSGKFGGEGVFAPSSEVPIYRKYPTPALGRAVSVKYESEDPFNFKIDAQTIAIQMRED